jgi:hypothetical protein
LGMGEFGEVQIPVKVILTLGHPWPLNATG